MRPKTMGGGQQLFTFNNKKRMLNALKRKKKNYLFGKDFVLLWINFNNKVFY